MVEGVNLTMIYLIYYKNFCKWHSVPPPSTTIKIKFHCASAHLSTSGMEDILSTYLLSACSLSSLKTSSTKAGTLSILTTTISPVWTSLAHHSGVWNVLGGFINGQLTLTCFPSMHFISTSLKLHLPSRKTESMHQAYLTCPHSKSLFLIYSFFNTQLKSCLGGSWGHSRQSKASGFSKEGSSAQPLLWDPGLSA
jgi:hypothetical protein